MSNFDTAIQRYRTLPRGVQWALLAAAGLVVFLIWDRGIDPITQDWNRKATVIETKLSEVRASEQIASDINKMKAFVAVIGPVQTPPDDTAGTAAFNALVNDVLKNHATSDQQFELRPRGNLPKTALTSMSEGKRVEKLTGELQFTAAPDVAIAVIAELESSPDIEMVNSVRLTKDVSSKVKVQLTLEAWIINKAAKADAPDALKADAPKADAGKADAA